MAQKDAWRAYYELALGFSETSRKKAMKIIKDVAGKSNVTADQMQELVNTALANREAMSRMVKAELDRALGRVGLATMDEVDELTRRVRDLERELQETRSGAAPRPAAKKTVAKKTVAKKTVAKKTVAKKTAAPTEPPAAKKAVAKKAVAKKAVAEPGASEPAHTVPAEPAPTASAAPSRKGPARKATVTRSPTKRRPAKKSASATTSPESAS